MRKTSKDLLQFEHKDPSSSLEPALLVCGKGSKSQQEKPKPNEKPQIFPLSSSSVLGRVKDFLGVIAEANQSLQNNIKDNPEDYDIECLKGTESQYIEMDLMLGIADLHTPEAVAAAEAATKRNQPVIDLCGESSNTSSSGDGSEDEEENKEEEEDMADNDANQDEFEDDVKPPPRKNLVWK